MEEFLCELNGKQFELMVDAGYSRKDRWVALGDAAGLTDFIKELEEAVERRLVAWIVVHSGEEVSAAVRDTCENVAWGVYLHWGAKHICCIMKEIAAAQKGGLQFLRECWDNTRLP